MVKSIESQRGLSRVEAVVGVVVLVVVVVSLVMLKGKIGFEADDSDADVESSSALTPQASDPTTAAPGSTQLRFAADSAKLPLGAENTLAPLVTALRADAALDAVVTAEPAGSATLERARAAAVRHAFEADGVSAARVVIETVNAGSDRAGVQGAGVRIELRVR